MKRVVAVLFVICLSATLRAQSDSGLPLPLKGGDSFTVPLSYEHVWILSHSQYLTAVKKAKKLEVADSLSALLELKAQKLREIIAEQDSVIALTREGYIHYRDLWQETDRKLEEAEIKAAKRWRFAVVGFLVGAGVAAATGAALAAIGN